MEYRRRTLAAAAVGEHRLAVRNTFGIPHQMISVVLDCMVMNSLIRLESLVVLEADMLDV